MVALPRKLKLCAWFVEWSHGCSSKEAQVVVVFLHGL